MSCGHVSAVVEHTSRTSRKRRDAHTRESRVKTERQRASEREREREREREKERERQRETDANTLASFLSHSLSRIVEIKLISTGYNLRVRER